MNPASQRAPWYGTVNLNDYNPRFRQAAEQLFQAVQARVGRRAVAETGSYSVRGVTDDTVQAKIVIYERGRGVDRWSPPQDGLYVLVRTPDITSGGATVAFQPNYDERFAYLHINDPVNRLVELTDFIIAVSDR